ncbi:MAG: DNA-binding protein [Prevotellaceae bacterium]|nr:DNA-binding protein [Prevotellaceae bacterium]
MIEFIIRKKVLNMGDRTGQTVYFAVPKTADRLPKESVVNDVVQRTSLAAGDLANAFVSLAEAVCKGLKMGLCVELGELGSLSVIVPSKMMDTPEEVTVEGALKKPKIVFNPTKKMLEALGKIELRIDRDFA